MAVKKIEGNLIAKDVKIGIVIGRFNEFIGSKLLEGAIDGFIRHGEMRLILKWHGYREPLKFL